MEQPMKNRVDRKEKNFTFFLAKYIYYCREMFSLLKNMGFFTPSLIITFLKIFFYYFAVPFLF